MSERQFDESEIGPILQRAAELQAGTAAGSSNGMTLGELQQLALEVGLHPEMVERAASEFAQQPADPLIEVSSTSLHLDRTIEGVVDDEAWEEIMASLRVLSKVPGTSRQRGATSEWMSRSESGSVTFTATKSGRQTRLRLIADMAKAVQSAWTLVSIFGVLAIIAGVKLARHGLSSWVALLVGVAIVAAGALGTHLIIRGFVKQSLRRWRGVFETATRLIRPANEVAPPAVSATSDSDLVQRLGNP